MSAPWMRPPGPIFSMTAAVFSLILGAGLIVIVLAFEYRTFFPELIAAR